MSKAFVRESDSADLPDVPAPVSPLPPGARNYLTAAGARRLRDELARLADVERPPLAAAGDDPETRRELKALDQRIRYLQQSLGTAEVVEPPAESDGVVRFGATVAVRDAGGEVSRYRLVGADEADPSEGAVSWLSPLAQALMNARPGGRVTFHTPAGERSLEIVAVEYARES